MKINIYLCIEKIGFMAVTGKLHTVRDNHAIKEAVISFIVTPQIVNSTTYGSLLDEGQPLCGLYHKFEPVKLRELKVEAGLNSTMVDSIKDAGFKFIAFKGGKTANVIQGLTQPRQGLLTFNTIDYQGWTKFKEESLNAAMAIANFQPVYVLRAFGLMFIDEFYFEEDRSYNPKLLFNLESRNLPKGIEDSDFVDYNFNLRRHRENKNYFDNVSIKVFNDFEKKIIRITENVSFEINPIPLVEALNHSDIYQYLDYSHAENKNTLRDILNIEVSKIIGL